MINQKKHNKNLRKSGTTRNDDTKIAGLLTAKQNYGAINLRTKLIFNIKLPNSCDTDSETTHQDKHL